MGTDRFRLLQTEGCYLECQWSDSDLADIGLPQDSIGTEEQEQRYGYYGWWWVSLAGQRVPPGGYGLLYAL